MSLEELEKQIYSRRTEGVSKRAEPEKKPEESASSRSEKNFPEDWQAVRLSEFEESLEEQEKRRPRRKVLFIAGIIVIVLILIVGGAFFVISRYLTGNNVSIEMSGPGEVYPGAPFDIDVTLGNQSNNILKNAALTLNLPEGVVALGVNNKQSVIDEVIGDIGVGSLTRKTYSLLAVKSGVSRKISVSLSYVSGPGTRFKTNQTKDVIVKESVVTLDVKAPEQALSDSVFTLDVNYRNSADFDFEDVSLEFEYPPQFKYVSATLLPGGLNNSWSLGELRHGSAGNLQIKGSLQAPAQSFFNFRAVLKADVFGEEYIAAEQSFTVKIAPSPINLAVLLNNQSDYIARLGDRLAYVIQYQNNSGIALADVNVKAQLSGEMFDLNTLRTNANVDTISNTLTWTAANVPNLRLLDPGASGEVVFELQVKNSFPIRRISDKNFYLRISAQIDSPSVPYYLTASKTSALANLETKVAGLVVVDAQGYFRDLSAKIINHGSLPPKVNQPTEFTIHWVVKNYGTDLKNLVIKTFLASGVSFTGITNSNISAVPLYNDRTQEVVWTIEKVAATRGVISDPVEAVFQVKAIPNLTQVGYEMPLISETTYKAVDDFTSLELTGADTALTTILRDDLTITQDMGRVAP